MASTARDLVVRDTEGRAVAVASHPLPRAPWWLHLLNDGPTPESRRNSNGAYHFPHRKALNAWLAEAGYEIDPNA